MRTSIRNIIAGAPLAAALLLGACEANLLDPSTPLRRAPRELDARYQWIFEGFRDLQSVGAPAVQVTWALPETWDGEVFRVYAREIGRSRYIRAATVTSCGDGLCSYTDRNVQGGVTYEYYVAAADERSGEEVASAYTVEVRVPRTTRPAPPSAPSVLAMDGALLLQWQTSGAAGALSHTRVFLVAVDGEAALYETGRTDGTAFLDTRTRNGHSYMYRLAAVDTLGHVSGLSAAVTGVPRVAAANASTAVDELLRSGFQVDVGGMVRFGGTSAHPAPVYAASANFLPAGAAYRPRPDEAVLNRFR